MSQFKTAFFVDEIIDDATNRFAPTWRVNNESKKGLDKCCKILDSIIERCNGEEFEFEVDDSTTDIIISIKVPEIIIQSDKSEYSEQVYALINASREFSIIAQDENGISLRLKFDGIWERTI